MPRNVRNFWIELVVDGVKTRVATGPKGKDGGFSLTIKQRQNGGIIDALRVTGSAKGAIVELEARAVDSASELRVITAR